MKKIFFLGLTSIIILAGAGCDTASKINTAYSPTTTEPTSTTNTYPDQNTSSSAKTLSQRGLFGIKVLDAVTKKPVPGAIVAIPYTTYTHPTDQNGYVEISRKYEKIYIAKMAGYQPTANIDLALHRDKEVIEVLLEPAARSGL